MGCSLALQYPCLGRHSLGYHIISLNPGICGEIRSEDTKTPSPSPLSSSTSDSLQSPSTITITHDAFGDMVVLLKRPGCDTNSPVLGMWNKHQLTTHQSLRDSPILFRSEWIILPNPNTPSAPCHGQSCWATIRIQCKLTPPRRQFQVRQSDMSWCTFSRAAGV